MSILSTAFSLGKTAVGFLTPAGSALKLAPWAIAGVLATALVIEHYRLVAADAGIKTAQAQTAQTVQKCQAEAATQAATASAAAMAQQAKADAAASQAEVQLFAARGVAQASAVTASQALGQQLGAVTVQAQAGQDGPVPAVLGSIYP